MHDHRRHHFAYQHEQRVWIRVNDEPTTYMEYSAQPASSPLLQDCHSIDPVNQLPHHAKPIEVHTSPENEG